MKLQTALEDSLYQATRSILDRLGWEDIPVIFSNEGGLEPPTTYCLINILERTRAGRVQEATASPYDQESLNVYTNYYTLYTQFSFIGSESGDVMFDFEDSVFSSRGCIESWQIRNLGPLSHSSSRRIPQLRETTWVQCYNIDLNLSYSVQSKESIDWIEYVKWDGKWIDVGNLV